MLRYRRCDGLANSEIELALEGSISEGKTAELLQKYGIQEYHEIPYIEVSS